LFCVASPEVDTIGYAILARHVDPDRPVYLLQAPPLNESVRRLQPPEFAQLAATYIEAMRDIQPTGPFNLIGMCSGSQIEIEICRKLEAEGESIAFSGILDTWALYTLSRGYYVKKALDLARYYSKRLRKMGAGSRSEEAVSADKPVDPGEPGNEGQKPLKRDGTGKAVRQYSLEEEVGWPEQQPPLMKIDSRVTVFRQRKRKQYWRIRDPLLGWGRHANSVDLVRLRAPGHKHIFREPWVRELARDLESRLA
jgi:thioesterase domain-containing protein